MAWAPAVSFTAALLCPFTAYLGSEKTALAADFGGNLLMESHPENPSVWRDSLIALSRFQHFWLVDPSVFPPVQRVRHCSERTRERGPVSSFWVLRKGKNSPVPWPEETPTAADSTGRLRPAAVRCILSVGGNSNSEIPVVTPLAGFDWEESLVGKNHTLEGCKLSS